MLQLPSELLSMIIQSLPCSDINNLALVCKSLYRVIVSDISIINSIVASVSRGNCIVNKKYDLQYMDMQQLFINCKLNAILKYIMYNCIDPLSKMSTSTIHCEYLVTYICYYSNLNMLKYFYENIAINIDTLKQHDKMINRTYYRCNHGLLTGRINLDKCSAPIIEYLINHKLLITTPFKYGRSSLIYIKIKYY